MNKLDYFALAIAIAFGVFAGQGMYGLTKLAWAKYELRKISVQLEQYNAQNVEKARHEKTVRDIQNAKQYKQQELQRLEQAQRLWDQRQQSPTGRKLQSECTQWRMQLETMKTQTVHEMAEKSCNRYQAFVETGTLPK